MLNQRSDQPPLKAAKREAGEAASSADKVDSHVDDMAVGGPEHPIWPDDGSLSTKNKDHLAAGLCAFDTLNPNAWSGVRKYMEATTADVLMTQ